MVIESKPINGKITNPLKKLTKGDEQHGKLYISTY